MTATPLQLSQPVSERDRPIHPGGCSASSPLSLALPALRLALARPFFASGLTRWDGWFTLSFGTKILFSDEYKLHIFGAEIPFPMPELVATMASTAEIVLPILLAFGFLTRYAALGLLGMTAVIQLTYPDGWANSICPGRRWRWRSWPSARARFRSTICWTRRQGPARPVST